MQLNTGIEHLDDLNLEASEDEMENMMNATANQMKLYSLLDEFNLNDSQRPSIVNTDVNLKKGYIGCGFVSHVVNENCGTVYVLDERAMPDLSVLFGSALQPLNHTPNPGEMFAYIFHEKYLVRAVRMENDCYDHTIPEHQFSARLIDIGCTVRVDKNSEAHSFYQITHTACLIPPLAMMCGVILTPDMRISDLLHHRITYEIRFNDNNMIFINIMCSDPSPFEASQQNDWNFYKYFFGKTIPSFPPPTKRNRLQKAIARPVELAKPPKKDDQNYNPFADSSYKIESVPLEIKSVPPVFGKSNPFYYDFDEDDAGPQIRQALNIRLTKVLNNTPIHSSYATPTDSGVMTPTRTETEPQWHAVFDSPSQSQFQFQSPAEHAKTGVTNGENQHESNHFNAKSNNCGTDNNCDANNNRQAINATSDGRKRDQLTMVPPVPPPRAPMNRVENQWNIQKPAMNQIDGKPQVKLFAMEVSTPKDTYLPNQTPPGKENLQSNECPPPKEAPPLNPAIRESKAIEIPMNIIQKEEKPLNINQLDQVKPMNKCSLSKHEFLQPSKLQVGEKHTILMQSTHSVCEFSGVKFEDPEREHSVDDFTSWFNSDEFINRLEPYDVNCIPKLFDKVVGLYGNSFYRAQVISVMDKHAFVIYYVDYGNCAKVRTTQLFKYDERWDQIPAYAMHFRINRVEEINPWDNEAKNILDKLLAGEVEATIIAVEECKKTRRTTYTVEMIDENGQNTADVLILKKIANLAGR